MPANIILGAQWGDEGKGKIVDTVAVDSDLVLRYQGGANAGHTVYIEEKKYVLHLLPSGILTPGIQCILGNGMVIDPEAFFDELDFLDKNNIDYKNRIFISDRAHLIFPYHKLIDQQSEKILDTNKIGTTGRGIGPAYVDKFNRKGIRLAELINYEVLEKRLKKNIEYYNKILVEQYYQNPIQFEEILENTKNIAEKIKPYVLESSKLIYDSWKDGKSLLLEGAQGSLLDIDFGTYPFRTEYCAATTSNQPHLLGLPVVAPNSLPSLRSFSPISLFSSVGKGPSPTLVT